MPLTGGESEPGESVTVTMRVRADAQVLGVPFDDTQPFPPPLAERALAERALAERDRSLGDAESTPIVARAPSPLSLEKERMSLEQATELRLEELRSGRRSSALSVTRQSEALVLACEADACLSSSRLCWRGIEVSDEFQGYALRVARGEELAPYRGRVLASGAPDFPWQTTSVPTRGRRAARLVGLSIGALLAALTAALAVLQAPPEANYRDLSAAPSSPRQAGAPAATPSPSNVQTRAGDAQTVRASLSTPNAPPNPAPAPKPARRAARAAQPPRPPPNAQHPPVTPRSPLLVEAPSF